MECTACCINFGSSWINGFSLFEEDDLVGDVLVGVVLDGDVFDGEVVVVFVLDGVLFVVVEVGLDLIPDALSMFALEEDAVLDVSTVVLVGFVGTCGGDLRDAFSDVCFVGNLDTDVCFVGNNLEEASGLDIIGASFFIALLLADGFDSSETFEFVMAT